MAVDKRTLYVARALGTVPELVAFDTNTRERKPWRPSIEKETYCGREGCQNVAVVNALAARSGLVYVGGFFSSIAGEGAQHLAAVDGETGQAMRWRPAVEGISHPGSAISTLALSGTTLYVAGGFDRIAGQPRDGLAALEVRGASAKPWRPRVTLEAGGYQVPGGVEMIVASGPRIYLGGDLQYVGGQRRDGLAAVDAADGHVLPWQGVRKPRKLFDKTTIYAVAMMGNRVYVGGSFLKGATKPEYIADAIDAQSSRKADWHPRPGGTVRAIAVSGNNVLVGGDFTSVNVAPRSGLAAIDGLHARLLPWKPRLGGDDALDPWIHSLLVGDGSLFVGGSFGRVEGKSRPGAAAFELRSRHLRAWAPRLSRAGTVDVVNTFAERQGVVYIGGDFAAVSGKRRNGLAALDADSGELTPWAPVLTGGPSGVTIESLAVKGKVVYAGGNFHEADRKRRPGAAAFDVADAAVMPWKPGALQGLDIPDIHAIQVIGDSVYLGGDFLGPASLIRVDTAAGRSLPFRPRFKGSVSALAAAPAGLIVGRELLPDGAAAVLLMDPSTGGVGGWAPLSLRPLRSVHSMAVVGRRLVIAGDLGSGGDILHVLPLPRPR